MASLCYATILSSPALAQISVSPALEPGRIDQNFEQPLEAQSEPRNRPEQATPPQQGTFAPDMDFVLRDLRIVGATAIDTDRLLATWHHVPGDTITVAEVEALANTISRAYSDAGYALSFAFLPAQKIEDGAVTIRVVEGYIDEVVLAGPAVEQGRMGPSRGVVLRLTERIRNSRPLRAADLERYLLLMNDLPGLTVGATLSPSPSASGGSVITLEIRRDSVSAELGYNSFLPRELKRNAIGAALRLNGYITGSDQLRLSTMHSLVPGAYRSVSGDYSTWLGSDGFRLELAASYSRTEPTSKALREIAYIGKSVNARVGISYPVIRSRARNLNLSAGVSLSNSDVDVLSTPLQRDRLRTIDASATYDFAGPGRSVNLVRVGLSKGVKVLDARGDSRANGSAAYIVADVDLQTDVPVVTLGRGQVSIFASAFGQKAFNRPLLSATECGFGGRQFGRAFDAGIATGDHCLLGSAELRLTAPVYLRISPQPFAIQLYGLIDFGMIRQRGALQPEELRSETGASAGAGVRLSISDVASAGFEATHSLRTPAARANDKGLHLNGSVSLRF
ncbi:ShlB/FhaC/HecB family hemolysin secretion/activation protein [Aurantiacibacter xanthus]|uniref:ShlB/FhaC/HecB family hemolysin secretion/activation protein n=1 Tax=Aurantiacibacter xanthus TaxID=1784712 RepID=A0A3A1P3Z1_9SPHN|nr:POTRA domain-containing protein [Aurantiacibacter xanthus]RIV86278.1 ShlB/FhaC/HecB family hemolysin secretion/activation protein [Aurantiacibacter xanthus]